MPESIEERARDFWLVPGYPITEEDTPKVMADFARTALRALRALPDKEG